MRVDIPRERSSTLRFMEHNDGITTLGFRSGQDYDYEDPEEKLFDLLQVERPGAAFRQARKDGVLPQHFAKRPAEVDEKG